MALVAVGCDDGPMVTPRTRQPREEISVGGRAAGITVGLCLVVSGAAFLLASWDELTCTPAGVTCDDVAGIGGIVSLVALAVTVAGLAIVATTARRPTSDSGSSAWTFGLAVIFSVGTTLISLRIPGYSCPDDDDVEDRDSS